MGYERRNGKDPHYERIEELSLEAAHTTHIFPEDTDETVTFTAGVANNAWLAWTEIVDNNAVTFSSKVAACQAHISAVIAEEVDTINKSYVYEIAYGDDKTIVSRARFASSAANRGNPIQETRVRAAHIPAGETVYYRMKCETGGATADVSIRYHCH